MLVLTRRISERLFINDQEIIITILGVKGNHVRLGIEADINVSVHREEVWNAIQEQSKLCVGNLELEYL